MFDWGGISSHLLKHHESPARSLNKLFGRKAAQTTGPAPVQSKMSKLRARQLEKAPEPPPISATHVHKKVHKRKLKKLKRKLSKEHAVQIRQKEAEIEAARRDASAAQRQKDKAIDTIKAKYEAELSRMHQEHSARTKVLVDENQVHRSRMHAMAQQLVQGGQQMLMHAHGDTGPQAAGGVAGVSTPPTRGNDEAASVPPTAPVVNAAPEPMVQIDGDVLPGDQSGQPPRLQVPAEPPLVGVTPLPENLPQHNGQPEGGDLNQVEDAWSSNDPRNEEGRHSDTDRHHRKRVRNRHKHRHRPGRRHRPGA